VKRRKEKRGGIVESPVERRDSLKFGERASKVAYREGMGQQDWKLEGLASGRLSVPIASRGGGKKEKRRAERA